MRDKKDSKGKRFEIGSLPRRPTVGEVAEKYGISRRDTDGILTFVFSALFDKRQAEAFGGKVPLMKSRGRLPITGGKKSADSKYGVKRKEARRKTAKSKTAKSKTAKSKIAKRKK